MTPRTIAFDCLNIKRGGGVTVALRLIEGFAAFGWTVHVLLASPEVHDLAKNLKHNARILCHFRPDLSAAPRALFFRHYGLGHFLREQRIDLLFGFSFWSPVPHRQVTFHVNVLPFLARRERAISLGPLRSLLQTFYGRRALSRSDLNIFESKHVLGLAEAVATRPIHNAVVRYIGVDLPDGIVRQSTSDSIITVTSGAKHKRNEHLIALHRKLVELGEPMDLIIGGFGKEVAIRGSLSDTDNAWIDSRDDIRFLGYCTREELYQELANATVLVTFSELESFFMVPVEAMAVGCPTITTNESSILESVGDAGILIDAGDVDSAVDEVIRLRDPMIRAECSAKAQDWAIRFDADRCVAEIVQTVETFAA